MFRAKTCAPRGTDLSIHYKGARCSFIMNNVLLPPGVQAVLDFLQKRDVKGAFLFFLSRNLLVEDVKLWAVDDDLDG